MTTAAGMNSRRFRSLHRDRRDGVSYWVRTSTEEALAMKTPMPRLAVPLLLTLSFPVLAGPGDTDVRFGVNGKREVDASTVGVHVTPEGRLLVVSSADQESPGIRLTRLSAEGRDDPAFGASGGLTIPLPGATGFIAAAMASKDATTLYVLGSGQFPDGSGGTRIAKLRADGTLDPAFGTQGWLEVPGRYVWRISVARDGSLVVGGEDGIVVPGDAPHEISEYRYLAALQALDGGGYAAIEADRGAWDPTIAYASSPLFSPNQRIDLKLGFPTVLMVDREAGRNEGYLMCGASYGVGITRYDSRFQLDQAFGVDGTRWVLGRPPVSTDESHYYSSCDALLPLEGGNVIAIGSKNEPHSIRGGKLLWLEFQESPWVTEQALSLSSGDDWAGLSTTSFVRSSADRAIALSHLTTLDHAQGVVGKSEIQRRALLTAFQIGESSGAGTVGFASSDLRWSEGSTGAVILHRSGGSDGAVRVRLETRGPGLDTAGMRLNSDVVSWSDGDSAPKSVDLQALQDSVAQGERYATLRLVQVEGAAALAPGELELIVEDDEALAALEFVEREVQGPYSRSFLIRIRHPGATGPLNVHYLIAGSQDPVNGEIQPGYAYYTGWSRGRLHWGAGDTSERAILVDGLHANKAGILEASTTMAIVALASSEQMLRDARGWKTAVIELDRPAVSPGPQSPASPPSSSSNGGAGAFSTLSLVLLGLVSLARTLRRTARRSNRAAS